MACNTVFKDVYSETVYCLSFDSASDTKRHIEVAQSSVQQVAEAQDAFFMKVFSTFNGIVTCRTGVKYRETQSAPLLLQQLHNQYVLPVLVKHTV